MNITTSLIRAVVAAIIFFFASWAWVRSAPGDIDPSFRLTPLIDDSPDVIVPLPDGRVLVGNSGYNPHRPKPSIVRLHANGEMDNTFQCGVVFTNSIRSLAICSDGKLLVFGVFSNTNGDSRKLVRLLPDGVVDSTLHLELDELDRVTGVAPLRDGRFVAGVIRSSTNRYNDGRIVRFLPSGQLDPSFAAAAVSGAADLLMFQPDGKLLAAGSFSSASLQRPNGIVRLLENGEVDPSFKFQTTAGTMQRGVPIEAMSIQSDGRIIIAASLSRNFLKAPGHVFRLQTDGTLDDSFITDCGLTPACLVSLPDGKVMVGGWFSHLNGWARRGLARLNSDGSHDEGFVGPEDGLSIPCMAYAPTGHLLVGGSFREPKRGVVRRLELGDVPPGSPSIEQPPVSQVLAEGKTVGFSAVARSVPSSTCQWFFNGVAVSHWTNGFISLTNLTFANMGSYSVVFSNQFGSVTSAPAHLIVNAGTISAGSVDLAFKSIFGPNEVIRTLHVEGERLYVGGSFRKSRGRTPNFTRLHADGTPDPSFNPDLMIAGEVHASALIPSGGVYVGGRFRFADGQPRPGIVRLKRDGAVDSRFSPDWSSPVEPKPQISMVRSLLVLPDGSMFIAGRFPLPVPEVVRKLRADGTRDPAFKAEIEYGEKEGRAVAVASDGAVWVAGGRESEEGWVVRLNGDGSAAAGFQAPDKLKSDVVGLNALENGKVLANVSRAIQLPGARYPAGLLEMDPSGSFSAIVAKSGGESPRHLLHECVSVLRTGDQWLVAGDGVQRVSEQGVIDPSFVWPNSARVNAIALTADGDVLAGGHFTEYGGVARNALVRLYGSPREHRPPIWGPFFTASEIKLSFPTVAGQQYLLETAADLNTTRWETLSNTPGDGQWKTVSGGPPQRPHQFFRIRVP